MKRNRRPRIKITSRQKLRIRALFLNTTKNNVKEISLKVGVPEYHVHKVVNGMSSLVKK